MLQSHLRECGIAPEPTWSDLDNLTPLTRSNLGQDSFKRHDFYLFFFPFNIKVTSNLVLQTQCNSGFIEKGCGQMFDEANIFGPRKS